MNRSEYLKRRSDRVSIEDVRELVFELQDLQAARTVPNSPAWYLLNKLQREVMARADEQERDAALPVTIFGEVLAAIPRARRSAVAHVMRQDAVILERDYAHLAGDFKPRTRAGAAVLATDLRSLADALEALCARAEVLPGKDYGRLYPHAVDRIVRKYPHLIDGEGGLRDDDFVNDLIAAMVAWMAATPGWEAIP